MPAPLLGSAHNGTELFASSWQLPSLSVGGDHVLLIGLVQNRAANDLTLPTGWTFRESEVVTSGDIPEGIQYALLDRFHPTAAAPYDDTFGASAPCRWSAAQLAFRTVGTSVPHHGGNHAIYGGAGATDPTLSAPLGGTAAVDNVLVAYCSLTTVGADPIDFSWPAGWTELEEIPAQATFIGVASVAYRVADGTETAVAPTILGSGVSSMVVLVAEYEIDPEPVTEPVAAVAWDVFDAADLLGVKIATLENAKGRYIRSALHDLGEGGFVINRHAAEATEAILAEGNMVKVRIPDCAADYLDGFFLGDDGDYTLLSPKGGEGSEDLTFRGLGALSYLDRARMTPCAFSLETAVGRWTEIWETGAISKPSGVAFDSAEPGYVYVAHLTTRKVAKVRQSDRVVVAWSPALWTDSTHYLGGISFDPSDSTIMWALEAPWLSGSSDHTRVRKIQRSDWSTLANTSLGSAIKHTDIRANAGHLWLSRYDGSTTIYKRSKSNPATVVNSYSITYNGVVQTRANGIAINGTSIAYWFGGTTGGGTGQALLADVSAPTVITGVQKTTGVAAFGGEWTTESGEQFLYAVSFTAGRTWKYQLTDLVPQCADSSGVFHPEQKAPGALAWRVLVEVTHVDRPDQPCPELTYDFTETQDSNGIDWPARTATEEFTWHVGDRAFSDVLAKLIPAGVTFDLDVNTMVLHAYSSFGVDRTAASFGSGKVRFVEGVNLGVNSDLARRDNRGQPSTNITVAGDDGQYGFAALGGRYVREGYMQVSGATTEAVLDAIGDDELARQRLVSDALGFETLWADAPLEGRYIPKKHYWKGDLVRVDMASGEFAYDEVDFRLYGTLITERDGGWRSVVDLGSAYKIPPPADSVPGSGSSSGSSTGGGASSGGGATTIGMTALTLRQLDPDTGAVVASASGTILDSTDWTFWRTATGVLRVALRNGLRLLGLADVDAADITDGQVLAWDAAQEAFVAADMASGTDGMVPYFIADVDTFNVPEFKQALFSEPIDVEGVLDVDGLLIEVD